MTDTLSVTMAGPQIQEMRELMTMHQTEEQRREIYLALTQPILQAMEHNLQSYFQQMYGIIPLQRGEDQVSCSVIKSQFDVIVHIERQILQLTQTLQPWLHSSGPSLQPRAHLYLVPRKVGFQQARQALASRAIVLLRSA